MTSDGKAIELRLSVEDGSEMTLMLPTSDLLKLVEVVVSAYQVAKTRTVMLGDDEITSVELEPTPLLVNVDRFGFVTQPRDDVGSLIVSPLAGPELHIRFQWPQLRALVEQIQSLDNIQSEDLDSTLPS